jgi:hypothetical protein
MLCDQQHYPIISLSHYLNIISFFLCTYHADIMHIRHIMLTLSSCYVTSNIISLTDMNCCLALLQIWHILYAPCGEMVSIISFTEMNCCRAFLQICHILSAPRVEMVNLRDHVSSLQVQDLAAVLLMQVWNFSSGACLQVLVPAAAAEVAGITYLPVHSIPVGRRKGSDKPCL